MRLSDGGPCDTSDTTDGKPEHVAKRLFGGALNGSSDAVNTYQI